MCRIFKRGAALKLKQFTSISCLTTLCVFVSVYNEGGGEKDSAHATYYYVLVGSTAGRYMHDSVSGADIRQ